MHGDGVAVGGRGHPAVFGFYANKQITTGEGGMVTLADGELKERIDSERNQGRARDMGWLDHDRLGFNYRLSDIACALGIAQLGRLEEMLAGRARVAGWYREALAEVEGLGLPCVDMAGDRRGWFVFVVQLPAEVERDTVLRRLAETWGSEQAVSARDSSDELTTASGSGTGRDELPVCEDVAARSLALPFFPEMTASQVERVAGELLGRWVGRAPGLFGVTHSARLRTTAAGAGLRSGWQRWEDIRRPAERREGRSRGAHPDALDTVRRSGMTCVPLTSGQTAGAGTSLT